MPAAPFPHRHLLGIAPLAAGDVVRILDRADEMMAVAATPERKLPLLRGRTVVTLFLEASTRTRVSFELAAKRLGADTVGVTGQASSTAKGETLVDTARNLAAMGADAIVVRHAASGAAAAVAGAVEAAVVNAGDGLHEHPSQALLDAATIRAHKGGIAGLEVAIVGDVAHSRVARSNVILLSRLGAHVRLCAPRSLLPRGIETLGEAPGSVRTTDRLEEAVAGVDVVMALRIQKERLEGAAFFPDTREYARAYGLSARTIRPAKDDAIVMHPGPINRGVEIDPVLADGPRAVILEQVTRGVAVRMAILALLLEARA